MPISTELTKRLKLTHPIIQAPMAGGATTMPPACPTGTACPTGALTTAIPPKASWMNDHFHAVHCSDCK